jgi:rare lipoprotein A
MTDGGTAPVRIEALGYRSDTAAGIVAYHPPKSYDTGRYAVQVAAFTVQDNARRLAEQMEKRYGASSLQEALVKGSRFYRVRVGRYGSLEKAEEARRQFERGSYPGSFVVATD